MNKRRSNLRRRAPLLALLVTGVILGWPPNALANCHIATLTENNVTVDESKPGYVELTVELEGDAPTVTCRGTIKWRTEAVTAKAGSDFKASSGEFHWTGPTGMEPRARTFRIPILNDSAAEKPETFRVVISAPSDSGIQPEPAEGEAGGPVAVIRITDTDKAGSSPTSGPAPTGTSSTGGSVSAAPTTTGTAQPTASSSATDGPAPTGTDGSARAAPPGTGGGGGGGGAVAAVAAAIVALGGLAAWLLRRRSASGS